MNIDLKYGDSQFVLSIPEKAEATVLQPASLPILNNMRNALDHALRNPYGCESFEEQVRQIAPKRVSIAVPDETRSIPVKSLLTILLDRLLAAFPGFDSSGLTLVIGGGLHPPVNQEGQNRLIPMDKAPGYRVVVHDAARSRMIDFGVTRRGTPVWINADFAEAEFKIVIGQIDPHQFVGFTGGAKGVVIGCAATGSIEHNHSLMFDDKAQVGRIDGNPVREDMNEAGEMVQIDLAVNIVLDANLNVVRVLAGEPTAVLKEGAKTCASLDGIAIEDKFDIVAASCGGYPKDISLYQAQKGLNLASQAVKHGGKILLMAACSQGVGDDIYFDYVSRFSTPEEVVKDFKRLGFKMGAHKAYLFGRTLIDYDVAIFSDLDPGILKKCHLKAAHPTRIMKKWVDELKGRPRVAVITNANTTYFYQKRT